MIRVGILSSHLSPGDAVSNDVVGMCEAFQRGGYEARVFAGSSDLADDEICSADDVRQFLREPGDLLIYHYSIAWEPGLELLQRVNCRKLIKYHNVTPPEFFAGISSWHEKNCRTGRVEVRNIIAARCDLYLADSEFNRADLLSQGADERITFVVAPFHHVDRLQMIDADLSVLDSYRDGWINIVTVGRVAPNKRHDDLIKAFALYHHSYNQESRLLIVGKEEPAFAIYSQRLRELTKFLALDKAVLFTGPANNNQLKAYYLLSNAFAMASEHEGFCVPIVEAMSLKVPVVAYGSSAIPGTLGDAGIVLSEREPALMAEALHRICSDEDLNVTLGEIAAERYRLHFTTGRIEDQLFQALNHLETLAPV